MARDLDISNVDLRLDCYISLWNDLPRIVHSLTVGDASDEEIDTAEEWPTVLDGADFLHECRDAGLLTHRQLERVAEMDALAERHKDLLKHLPFC